MNILITIVSVVFIVVSALATRNQVKKVEIKNVLPAETALIEEFTSPSPEATFFATSQATSVPTATTQVKSQNISQFFYPNATIKSQSESSALLVSSDDAGKITDWYETKIKSMGYSAKSFVKTNSNNNILNKLSGAKEGEEINIVIKKSPGEDVQIEVSY